MPINFMVKISHIFAEKLWFLFVSFWFIWGYAFNMLNNLPMINNNYYLLEFSNEHKFSLTYSICILLGALNDTAFHSLLEEDYSQSSEI